MKKNIRTLRKFKIVHNVNRLLDIFPLLLFNRLFRLLTILVTGMLVTACAVQPGQHMQAFLPMVETVPRSEPADIDGVWRISTIGKDIHIEEGRAYAVDGWLHLFTLQIKPNMVVIQNIQSDGMGGYSGYDLPLMGNWQAKKAPDGALDVTVARSLGPVSYRLLPVYFDNDNPGDDEKDYEDDYADDDENTEPPISSPLEPIGKVGNSIAEIGRNCYTDWKPMGQAMLKYQACQAGLGNFNALKQAMKSKKIDDAKSIMMARGCSNEFNNLINTVRHRGFKSISLGLSGELAAIIGGTGESFLATNLDLSNPTLYGSLGAGIGSQVGGSVNGVVSVYLDPADKLSGKGKSFSVSMKALGGAGGAIGLSSGKSPSCESFSASAGAGAAVNAGSVSSTRTFRLIRLPKPDFTAACKNVKVKARNLTKKEIKIIDVDFYDYDNKRWRSKIIKNTVVKKGKTWKKALRLQKVGGDRTKVKVQYRVLKGKGLFNAKKWSKVKSKESSVRTCKAGMTFSANLI